MFGFGSEWAVLFVLPHGFKASGEDSVLDGVFMEAQLHSSGVRACRQLPGGRALGCLLTSASSPPPAS